MALSSWNDGNATLAILDFVSQVTLEGGAQFVPPDDRIAVFDNDGTLWHEQPHRPAPDQRLRRFSMLSARAIEAKGLLQAW